MRWVIQHPGHPDESDVARKSAEDWNYYLKTVRPHLGWTILVGHKAE